MLDEVAEEVEPSGIRHNVINTNQLHVHVKNVPGSSTHALVKLSYYDLLCDVNFMKV